jgi:hypothetical protein
MKNLLRIVGSLQAAMGAITLISCSNSVVIGIMPGLNKPAPVVKQGDVVQWIGLDRKPMKVQFTVFSPCREGLDWTDTCHVNTTSGQFIYNCDNNQCDDPELPVGSDYGVLKIRAPQQKTAGFSSYVGVYCDPNTHTAAVQPQTAKYPQFFQWTGIGSPPPASWWVTVAPGTCQEGNEFGTRNNDGLKCTLLQSAATQNNYTVHVDGCGTPDSNTGKLTIQ